MPDEDTKPVTVTLTNPPTGEVAGEEVATRVATTPRKRGGRKVTTVKDAVVIPSAGPTHLLKMNCTTAADGRKVAGSRVTLTAEEASRLEALGAAEKL